MALYDSMKIMGKAPRALSIAGGWIAFFQGGAGGENDIVNT